MNKWIFSIMLAKSIHQLVRIEFWNTKFPYASRRCPLATPVRGLCPLDPPDLVINLPPLPVAGSAPGVICASSYLFFFLTVIPGFRTSTSSSCWLNWTKVLPRRLSCIKIDKYQLSSSPLQDDVLHIIYNYLMSAVMWLSKMNYILLVSILRYS